MIKVLFICHGNICRSPMAEFVMKDLVKKQGMAQFFEIASAATTSEEIWGGHGNPIYPPARKQLIRHGIGTPDNELGVSQKEARLLTKSDYAYYDRIIGMDDENFYDMKRILKGDLEGKVSLLMDYTDRPGNVADPWYTRNFDATWRDVNEGCLGLYEYLLPIIQQ